jgi:hypothetical protein
MEPEITTQAINYLSASTYAASSSSTKARSDIGDFALAKKYTKVSSTTEEMQWRTGGRRLFDEAQRLQNPDMQEQSQSIAPRDIAVVGGTQLLLATLTSMLHSMHPGQGSPGLLHGIPRSDGVTTPATGSGLFLEKTAWLRPPRSLATTVVAQETSTPADSISATEEVPCAPGRDCVQDETLIAFLRLHQYLPQDDHQEIFSSHLLKAVVDLLKDPSQSKAHSAELSRCIAADAGYFGENEADEIAEKYQLALIRDWIEQRLFGSNLLNWLVQKIAANDLPKDCSTALLRKKLHDTIYANSLRDEYFSDGQYDAHGTSRYHVSSTAHWIWENVIAATLPVLSLSRHGFQESWKLNDLRWGQLHAGLRCLQESGTKMHLVSRNEARDLGQLLLEYAKFSANSDTAKIGETGSIWVDYFRLPALLHYAATDSERIKLSQERQSLDIEQAAMQSYLDLSETDMSTVAAYEEALANVKSRPELARLYLSGRCPTLDVETFINRGDGACPTDHVIHLEDINEIYKQHLDNFGKLFQSVDQFFLQNAWQNFDGYELDFIQVAQLQRMHAEFISADKVSGRLNSDGLRFGAMALIPESETYSMRPGVELFAANTSNAERIYALCKNTNGYEIRRVDRDKSLYQDLLPPLERDKIKVADRLVIRINGEPLDRRNDHQIDALVHDIANAHRRVLVDQLYAHGYQATMAEKIKDFMLSLIPFYNCINENLQGRHLSGGAACAMDVLLLAPLAGNLISASMRASQHLAHGALVAWRQAGKAVANKAAATVLLRDSAYVFLKQGVVPALGEVGKNDLLINTVRVFDPGFELVGRLTAGSVRSLVSFGRSLQKSLPALSKSLGKLESRIPELPELLAGRQTIGHFSGSSSPVMVRILDEQSYQGKPLVARITQESGEIGGRKYVLADDGTLTPFPVKAAQRLAIIREQGLSGRGAIAAGQSEGVLYRETTLSDFLNWVSRSPSQRNIKKFAEENRIPEGTWQSFVAGDGQLRASGLQRFLTLIGRKTHAVKADDIQKWCRMTQEERDRIGKLGYAVDYRINANSWDYAVHADGSLGHTGDSILRRDGNAALADSLRVPDANARSALPLRANFNLASRLWPELLPSQQALLAIAAPSHLPGAQIPPLNENNVRPLLPNAQAIPNQPARGGNFFQPWKS